MIEQADEHGGAELWERLGALPAHDLAPDRALRLRHRAHEALPRPPERRPEAGGFGRIYLRALEPAWVASVAALQLALAAERIWQIYGG
jgi:hypothetical protein